MVRLPRFSLVIFSALLFLFSGCRNSKIQLSGVGNPFGGGPESGSGGNFFNPGGNSTVDTGSDSTPGAGPNTGLSGALPAGIDPAAIFGGPYALGGSPQPINFAGFSPFSEPKLAVSDFPFEDFGPVDVGSAAERTLVVGNFGLSPANNIFMSLNPVESDFSYAGGTCGAVIAPLASCRVIIRFEPKEKRQYQTNLVIVYFNGAGTANYAIRELRAEGVENPLRLATGDEHTCAVVENGTVKCWGLNDNGQLGDGTKTTRYAPAPVHYFGKKGSAVATGFRHSCAVFEGDVYCWGYNGQGELGVGNLDRHIVPTKVQGLSDVVKVDTYHEHTCAIDSQSRLYCWGYNGHGELGVGDTSRRTSPVQVLTDVREVATGTYHTCALKNDGSVWCTGYNGQGQLGNGANSTKKNFVQVTLSPARRLDAAHYQTCAITENDKLYCWGQNAYGELGDGSRTNRNSPRLIHGSNVKEVAMGTHHTCSLIGDALKCSGYNGYGQIGDGTTTLRASPVYVVNGASGVTQVWAGYHQTFAVIDDSLYGWGRNTYGAIGDNSNRTAKTPSLVPSDYLD